MSACAFTASGYCTAHAMYHLSYAPRTIAEMKARAEWDKPSTYTDSEPAPKRFGNL